MLRERIAEALAARNMTAADLARACDVRPPSVSAWLSGDTKSLRAEVLLKASRALGVSPEWLATGAGTRLDASEPRTEYQAAPDMVEIPIYNARAAAGDGAVNDRAVMIGSLTFKRASLERRGLNWRDLGTVYVDGDSMSPRIEDGDVVIYDRTKSTLRHGEIYVLRYDDELLVKRLHKSADGAVILVSDNDRDPRYAPRAIPPDRISDLTIVGQVVWMGGWA